MVTLFGSGRCPHKNKVLTYLSTALCFHHQALWYLFFNAASRDWPVLLVLNLLWFHI